MIKVTLGEVKTQDKPFPKIVKYTYSSGNYCILLMKDKSFGTVLDVKTINEKQKIMDEVGQFWDIESYPKGFEDYNEPVTIQNA